MGTDMVQVSIPFCLELGTETETFQEQVETKLVFQARSIGPPSSVVRAGPKEDGEVGLEVELQTGWETLERACPSILIFLHFDCPWSDCTGDKSNYSQIHFLVLVY